MSTESDGRECGWMGCHHPRCADLCAAVPLDEWREWKAASRPVDPYLPTFGEPVTNWHRWFAWRPVETVDRGWRWLRPVRRRRIQKHDYLFGGADFWMQHAVETTPAAPSRRAEANGERDE